MFLLLLLGQVAGLLVGSAVDHVAGQATDTAVSAVRARLARGRIALPQNHDLERAHRRSLQQAIRYLVSGVLPVIVGRRAGRARLWWVTTTARPVASAYGRGGARSAALDWCRALERAAQDDGWLDSWTLGTLEPAQLESIAAGQVDGPAMRGFHELVLERLEGAGLGGPVPAEVRTAVLAGWQVAEGPDTKVVNLYNAYCLFFQALVAHDAVLASKVEMSSRAVLIARHDELLATAGRASLAPDAVLGAIRSQVGPALDVLGAKVDDLSRGVADVAVALAAQTTSLARLEDAVARVESVAAVVDDRTARIEETTTRIESATAVAGDLTERTLAAVTGMAELLSELHARGRGTTPKQVRAVLERYRAWTIAANESIATAVEAPDGGRLRLALADLDVGDIPVVRRGGAQQQGAEVLPAAEVLRGPAVLVTGGGGSGKSTLLRWLALTVAGDDGEPLPPLLITCRSLRGSADQWDVPRLVEHALRVWGAASEAEIEATGAVLTRAVVEGHAVLAIDGLDEIANGADRLRLAEALGDLVLAHPHVRLVVTTREAGAGAAVAALAARLTEAADGAAAARTPAFEIAPLGPRQRATFLRAWGAMRGLAPDDADSAYAPLLSTDDDGPGALADTVQMLTLLAQAQDEERDGGARALPSRRGELLRWVVGYQVAAQRAVEPATTVEELVPRLEHLALRMQRRGRLVISESEAVALLREFDENVDLREYPSVAPRRSAPDVVALLRRLELLVYAGPGPSRRGIAQDQLQFPHQSFADYFAGSGMVHRWCEQGGVLEELTDLARAARASDPPGLSPGQLESVRHAVERLDGQQLESLWFGIEPDVPVDEALGVWLAAAGEEGVRDEVEAVLVPGLLALAGASELTVAPAVVDGFLDRLGIAAGGSTAALHTAVGAVLRSAWGDRLLAHDATLTGDAARAWGTAVMSGMQPLGVEVVDAEEQVRTRLDVVASGESTLTRARALLELTELCFELQRCTSESERVDDELQPWAVAGLSEELRSRCWDVLLPLIEDGGQLARLGSWALGWATCAFRAVGDLTAVTPERVERVRLLLRTSPLEGPRDPWVVADLGALLALPERGLSLYAQLDWVYLAALVADGALPRRSYPMTEPTEASIDGEWLAGLAAEAEGRCAARLALTANRRGAFPASDPLWEWFTDGDAYVDERDEAWFGSLRAGGPALADRLLPLLDFDADEYLQSRAILGLVVVADVETLQRLAVPGPRYDRAYLFALAGHEDPRGRAAVESIATSHPDAELRAEADAVLAIAREWDEQG